MGEESAYKFHYEIWMNALLHQRKFDAQHYYYISTCVYKECTPMYSTLSQSDWERTLTHTLTHTIALNVQ